MSVKTPAAARTERAGTQADDPDARQALRRSSASSAWPTWLLTQTQMYAHRLLSERLAGAGARGYHYRLLAAAEEFGPTSQAALARHTGIDRSDVVAALNELAERGMVERSPDPADRRRNIITITRAGRRHIQRLERILTDVQDELLAPLSPAQRRKLIGMLTRVLEHQTSNEAQKPGPSPMQPSP